MVEVPLNGQCWEQKEFPFCKCMTLWIKDDQYIRIAPNHKEIKDSVPLVYETVNQVLISEDNLRQLLEALNYTPVGIGTIEFPENRDEIQ